MAFLFSKHLDMYKAVYTQTTRGKEQLIFCGQPFIYEKSLRLPTGETKKLWRCNQWCVFSSFCELILTEFGTNPIFNGDFVFSIFV